MISRNDFRAFKITVALTSLEILNFVVNVKEKELKKREERSWRREERGEKTRRKKTNVGYLQLVVNNGFDFDSIYEGLMMLIT